MNKAIYFSGIDRASFIHLLGGENVRLMISPPQKLLNPAIIESLKLFNARACADSGGFQGQTDVVWYADVIQQSLAQYDFDWFPNLDVIGDSIASQKNYERLIEILPKEIHHKILWVYQGGDLAVLKEICATQKYIGIGGLVPLSTKLSLLQKYLAPIGEILMECNATAHLFGITGAKSLKWLCFQPWFQSADSTSWMYGLKATDLFKANGDRVSMQSLGLMLTKEERARNNVRVIQSFLKQQYYAPTLFDIAG